MRPCRDAFESLAVSDPSALELWIRSGDLRSAHMSDAAEILGKCGEQFVATLLYLLDNASPLVREGALIGLSHHLKVEGVSTRLLAMLDSDPSPGVQSRLSDMYETRGGNS